MKVPGHLNLGEAYLWRQNPQAFRKSLSDEIVLPARIAEILEFENLAKAIPEVRKERVEAIRDQIESKTYVVNGNLVANSIAEFLR